MPVHDWSRVDAGVFHAFHHGWIEELARALNRGILPGDYYALPEQLAAGFGPDVLAPQGPAENNPAEPASSGGNGALLVARPKVAATAEADLEFYRRKATPIVVRHVTGDRVVAMIEVVSPGNKSSRHALRSFIEKAAELLDQRCGECREWDLQEKDNSGGLIHGRTGSLRVSQGPAETGSAGLLGKSVPKHERSAAPRRVR